jgi:hypothetical protein
VEEVADDPGKAFDIAVALGGEHQDFVRRHSARVATIQLLAPDVAGLPFLIRILPH